MTRIEDRALGADDLAEEPLVQFTRWYDEARERGAVEPDAMALATADPKGAPSMRMVLMKGFDERGIRFFTNYGSRKGLELARNPHGALLFHWPELGRQVRVEGSASRLERAESIAYARRRSRPSQLSALASPQSRTVPSREWLEEQVAALEREYARNELPVAEEWGGYRLRPAAWEFWQHRPNRLHDRFRYEHSDGGWRIDRLGP